jgi:hypothetical protein
LLVKAPKPFLCGIRNLDQGFGSVSLFAMRRRCFKM